MELPYSKREKLAGLFLIFGVGMIFITAIVIGGGRDWFRSYYSYYALYDEGYGLSPGVKVKFLRTDVGLVTRLELTDNNKVKVHMSILSEYASRIKSDSQAAIESPTLIGSEYIDVIPGSAEADPVPQGGQIPARERKSINDILKELRLEEKLRQVEDIMANVNSLTYQLQDPNGPLLGTMHNFRKLTANVAAGEGSIGKLVVTDEVYNDINLILKNLEQTTSNISATSAKLNKSLPATLKKIDAILVQVETASRSVPELGRGAREGMRSVNQVLDSAKRNILIRGNLFGDPDPETLEYPARRP